MNVYVSPEGEHLGMCVQYNCILGSRLGYVGVTRCPLNPRNFIYNYSVRVLVVVNARETLCDFYTIWHESPFVGVLGDRRVRRTHYDFYYLYFSSQIM